MHLTADDERMLDGQYGPGVQKAMALLVKIGKAYDADKMVKVNWVHTHIDLPPYQFIKEIMEGANPTTRVTMHPMLRPDRWLDLGIVGGIRAEKMIRMHQERVDIAKRLGWLLTSTCALYLIGFVPRKSDVISMIGTCMQVMNNSLYGALVTRIGDLATLASAVTGKTPYMGIMKPENRFAHVVVELNDLDVNAFTATHYSVMGYYVGENVPGFKNVVVKGLPEDLPFECARALCIPLPTSGAATLCHIVGVTPEAATLEQALGHKKPEQTIIVGRKEIRDTWEKLNTARSDDVDHVCIGCPHLTIEEIKQIASMLGDKKVKASLLLAASVPVVALARELGYADVVEKAGGVFLDCCIADDPFPSIGEGINVVATNSSRAAHYITRVTKARTFIGTTEECVAAAVTGKWRGEPRWN